MANPSLQIGNDNWAIKEDNLLGYSTAGTRFVPQPITMTRATLGTRVNPSGLVEDVELLGGELVVNGDFSNGSTSWNKSTQVTIENGVANIISNDGSFQYFGQSNVTTIGKSYLLRYTIVSNNNGDLRFGNFGGINSSIGSHSFYFVADETSCNIARNSGITDISIDNVSVKEATIDNLPRVDYTDGTSSLLVEPLRTNLVTYSEDFSQWGNTQVTIEPNATTSPDGTLNASRITPTTTSSVHLISTSGSTTMAISIYAKSNGYHRFRFNSGSSGNGYASFDLNAGTVLNSGGTYYTSSSIDSVGNGWYRCTLVLTSGVASVTTLAIEDNSGNVSFIGDGTSAIYTWGGQSEVGSYATSYIKTSGGTVTRVQETYEKTGISDLINSEEGVLFFEMAALSDDGTLRCITLSDGGITNRVLIIYDTQSNSIRAVVVSNAGTSFDELHTVTSTLDFHKIAIKWKLNDFALWIDGDEVATDTSGAAPIGLDRIVFDVGNGTYDFYGKVKQLQIYKTALSDDELTILTGTSGVHFFPSYASMASDLTYTIE